MNKPIKPIQPQKTISKYHSEEIYPSTIDDLLHYPADAVIDIRDDGHFYLQIMWTETVDNPNYDKEYQQYLDAYKKYKADIRLYNKEQKLEKIKRLEEQLIKLKGKNGTKT